MEARRKTAIGPHVEPENRRIKFATFRPGVA
jgi:hypothetical protein